MHGQQGYNVGIACKKVQILVFKLSWRYYERRIKANILTEDGHVDTWKFFAVFTTFSLQSRPITKLGGTLKSQTNDAS